HYVGFMAADEIFRRYNFSPFRDKFDGQIAEGKIEGEKVYLLKPHTFMNLSGNSVVKAANFYKILPQNIVVIHDDMDLPIDKIKAKIGGGSGGHNGLKSIDAAISPNYNRIRLGIGHPQSKAEENVINHVLSSFSKADKQILEKNIDIVADLLPILLKKGMAEFSNQLGMALNKK
ncbi:MAG: aminoacyl-tRNA hydrolase, partial [Alphaproteobacteria bacterium]|nr:aminoacyl-tRNA hydrolase [Alphaproteobacteria bacterium]